MAAAVARGLDLPAAPVCAVGGAIENLARFRERFAAALAAQLPASRLVMPRGDACAGALTLAAGRLGRRR
jgi:phenylacetic acid degradation operon negative regulatory protein